MATIVCEVCRQFGFLTLFGIAARNKIMLINHYQHLERAGNIRDIKAWLLQFVSRIELGYNTVKIFYTYPMTDLLNSRNALLPRGGTSFRQTANGRC